MLASQVSFVLVNCVYPQFYQMISSSIVCGIWKIRKADRSYDDLFGKWDWVASADACTGCSVFHLRPVPDECDMQK